MPNGWTPTPLERPYRIMVVGTGLPTFFAASEEEKETVFMPRFRQMLVEWEELGRAWSRPLRRRVPGRPGGRAVLGVVPDLEVDSLDVAAAMIQAARETVDGVRLDTYVKLELRVGRPFWAREEQPQPVA